MRKKKIEVEPQVEVRSDPQKDEVEPNSAVMRPKFFEAEGEYPGAEYLIRLFRRDERSKEWVPQGKLTDDEATAEFIGRTFGGGYYRVIRHRMTDGGKWVFAGQTSFSNAGVYKPPRQFYDSVQDERDQGVAPTRAAPVAGPYPSAGESLNAALVGSVIELLKAQREAAKVPVSSFEWGPILVAAVPVVQTLVTKLMEKPATDPVLLGFLQKVERDVAALEAKPGPTANAVTDVLDSIERIVKVSSKVRRLAGEDDAADPETAMWNLGKKALEAMTGPALAGSGTAPLAGPSPSPGPMALPKPLWERVLIRHGRDLLTAASRGVDPGLAAEWTVTMLPAEVQGAVSELVRKPDVVAIAMRVIPDLVHYPGWTEEFFVAARGLLLGEPDAVDEEDGGGEVEALTA